MTLTTEQMNDLARPFPADAIDWKPGATNGAKDKALALAYVDLRRYFDRLDEIAPGDWADDYDVLADGTIVKCRLSIAGVTRCDVGQKDDSDQNTTTAAAAQAFKRACAKFGLGRHLYDMPQIWAEYDGQRKRFTDGGLSTLRTAAQRATTPAPERKADKATTSTAKPAENGNGKTSVKVETDTRPDWRNPDEAKAWAMSLGAFDHAKHCANAYDKLRREALASENPPTSAAAFFDLWYTNVVRRMNASLDKQAASESPRF